MPILLNGKATTVKAIQLELKKAESDALTNAELAVVEKLQRLIDNLNRRSTKRTRLGNFSRAVTGQYDKPMKNATVVVERVGDKRVIYVDDYIFNLLDQGRGRITKRGRGYMTFPAYEGTLTRPDSYRLFRTRVKSKPRWVKVKSVAGFAPRNFLANLLKDLKIKRRKKTSIFEFDVDGSIIDFTIKRRS